MRTIDLDSFRKDCRLAEHCKDCDRSCKDCDKLAYTAKDFCGWLDDAPVINAIPLDTLCLWMAQHYSYPCQTIDDCPCNGEKDQSPFECWWDVFYALIHPEVKEQS